MRSAHVHAVRSEAAASYAPETAPAPGDPLARLERAGPRALDDHELLALVGVHVDAATLAATGGLRGLLDDPDGSPRNFLLAREDRARVHALLDLHLRWMEAHLRRDGPLTSPEATRRYLAARLRAHPFEVFACLFLDNRHRVIAFEALFRGTVDGTSVHPREVVRCALRHNAQAVILCHNHPSGEPEPSHADRILTDQLVAALAMVEVRVLDHLVIGDGACVSFSERGLL